MDIIAILTIVNSLCLTALFFHLANSVGDSKSSKGSELYEYNEIKWGAALKKSEDSNTDSRELDDLSFNPDWRVRNAVARHSKANQRTLNRLSLDSHWVIRESVAKNPNTSAETLYNLKKDDHPSIKEALKSRLPF